MKLLLMLMLLIASVAQADEKSPFTNCVSDYSGKMSSTIADPRDIAQAALLTCEKQKRDEMNKQIDSAGFTKNSKAERDAYEFWDNKLDQFGTRLSIKTTLEKRYPQSN